MTKEQSLIAALQDWASDNEGQPSNPADARLLKALWSFDGDRKEPCPECDGECGEPCAPCTVADAHGSLDAYLADYNEKHGIVQVGK